MSSNLELIFFSLLQWGQETFYVFISIFFILMVMYILWNRKLKGWEKFLLVLLCVVFPLLGWIVTFYYIRSLDPVGHFGKRETGRRKL